MDLFKFMFMAPYEKRVVDRYEFNDLIIDTVAQNDQIEPYETGVLHPFYNGGKWVIVELYSSKEDAQTGHKKWIKTMTNKKLPNELRDVSGIAITDLLDCFAEDEWRIFKKKKVI